MKDIVYLKSVGKFKRKYVGQCIVVENHLLSQHQLNNYIHLIILLLEFILIALYLHHVEMTTYLQISVMILEITTLIVWLQINVT